MSRNTLIALIVFIAAMAGTAIYVMTEPAPPPPRADNGAGGVGTTTPTTEPTQQVQELRVAGGQWRVSCPGAAVPAPPAAGGAATEDATDEAAAGAVGDNNSEPKRCRSAYRITTADADPKFLAAMLFVMTGPERKPVLVLTFRPQAKMDQDVFLRIDDQRPNKLPRGRCNDKFCAIEVELTAEGLNLLKQGRTAYISWVTGQGIRVRAPVSLATFAAAADELARARR